MRQERKQLLMDLFDAAIDNKDLRYVETVYEHQMETKLTDYQYLEATGFIDMDETVDSERWEVSLTNLGIERAQALKNEEEKLNRKTEDEIFKEKLDVFWDKVYDEGMSIEQLKDSVIAFSTKVSGLSNLKGYGYVKIADMVVNAYVRGLSVD